MTVTAIGSNSVGWRRFPLVSTSLTVSFRIRRPGNRDRGGTAEATVSVSGDIDSANAGEFAAAVRAATDGCSGLVLDLTEVDFMAVDGISALHAINAHVLRRGARWCAVASSATLRVLELCDPEGLIPVARISPLRGTESA